MKKVAYTALLSVLASAAVCSAEVGARNPQQASSAKLEVAIAETGTSNRWTAHSHIKQVDAQQLAEHLNLLEKINAEMNTQLEADIERKLNSRFELQGL